MDCKSVVQIIVELILDQKMDGLVDLVNQQLVLKPRRQVNNVLRRDRISALNQWNTKIEHMYMNLVGK